mgnify:CR=1 FL=1
MGITLGLPAGYYGGKLDTVVTWTLSPTASGGTKLRLEHSGFTAKNAFAFENMGKGEAQARRELMELRGDDVEVDV